MYVRVNGLWNVHDFRLETCTRRSHGHMSTHMYSSSPKKSLHCLHHYTFCYVIEHILHSYTSIYSCGHKCYQCKRMHNGGHFVDKNVPHHHRAATVIWAHAQLESITSHVFLVCVLSRFFCLVTLLSDHFW